MNKILTILAIVLIILSIVSQFINRKHILLSIENSDEELLQKLEEKYYININDYEEESIKTN